MANYIITKNKNHFKKLGFHAFALLEDLENLPDRIAIDTETTGLIPKHCDIFCVQIGTGKDNYIIHMYDDNFEFQDIVPYIKDKELVGHNITFDVGFFHKYGFYPKNVFDTMLASKIIYNGDIDKMRNDFGTVMHRELDVYYDKTDQKNIHIVKLSQESTIKYSFNDVDRLLELHDGLLDKLEENGQLETYFLHCRYTRALAYMESCGLPINSEKWLAKMKYDEEQVLLRGNQIKEYIYDTLKQFADMQIDMFSDEKRILVSLTSPIQMIKVFEALGINVLDKDDKKSINEAVITKTKHDFVTLWLQFQEANHRVSTFGKSIYNKIEDGRIYTSFNPAVDTARLSSRRGGINFLNFPSDKITRDCFEAKPGFKMIVCDYSAQEGVIMADISGDAAMTASVVEGKDLHCMLAKVLFPELEDLTDEDITVNHKAKRTAAKVPRFLFSYGGNGYTLHVQENIPKDRAYEIEKGFKELHAGLYSWGDTVYATAVKTGFIVSAEGWRLRLPKFELFEKYGTEVNNISKDQWKLYKEGKLEHQRKELCKEAKKEFKLVNTEAYNYYKSKRKVISDYFKIKSSYMRLCLNNPIQSTGAHQIKRATIYLFDWIIENDYIGRVKICNSVHDELVVEVEDSLAEETRLIVQKLMKEAGNYYLTNLTLEAEAALGASWYEAK